MYNQELEWEESYRRRDNFVFYPHEEVIRFVSKYIRKRIGLSEFKDIRSSDPVTDKGTLYKVLDFGCGIGRHIIYCHEMGLDSYGIDLSGEAVSVARKWAKERGLADTERRILQGDVSHLPWPDGFFDYAISHGVLDSMHYDMARTACIELVRVLTPGGLFYCDLVSGDDSAHAREFCGEEIVSIPHERGTIQSYFNYGKILGLTNGLFEVVEALLIRHENILNRVITSRYHIVFKRI